MSEPAEIFRVLAELYWTLGRFPTVQEFARRAGVDPTPEIRARFAVLDITVRALDVDLQQSRKRKRTDDGRR